MQYIGFVGSSKADQADTFAIEKAIKMHLLKYVNTDTTIVSGGGEGIDTMAIKYAKELDFETIEYKPTSKNWVEYKKRNIQIANKCDKIISFALELGTLSKRQCYHCSRAGRDNNHEKTAGCYTGYKNGNYEVVIV
jgi:hypothetical protein